MLSYSKNKVGVMALVLLLVLLALAPVVVAKPKKNPEITDSSDLNRDQVVDTLDLQVFSSKYLELNWETVDWCVFYTVVAVGDTYNGKPTKNGAGYKYPLETTHESPVFDFQLCPHAVNICLSSRSVWSMRVALIAGTHAADISRLPI